MTAAGVAIAVVLAAASSRLAAAPTAPQPRVDVRPVFFVPADQDPPTAAQRALLAVHLRWSQRRYSELLGGRDSFLLDTEGLVFRAARPLAFYRAASENGAPEYVAELLRHLGKGRFEVPHIFVIVVKNPADDFPSGGGRPLNGGIGTGGGIVILSSFALDRLPNVQSTLQHELGHAFGLVHADAYGEDMRTSRSLMSYNPAHHTSGLQPSLTPGELLPVEMAALAMNRRVFPALAADTIVAPRPISGRRQELAWFPPMNIPGQPEVSVRVTTPSGEAYGSCASVVVQGRIRPSRGPGITYDASAMWHSDSSANGWVGLELTFPEPVALTAIGIHTEHSGRYHRAAEARIAAVLGGVEREVAREALSRSACLVEFAAATALTWRITLRAGPSGQVVVRGLEFRSQGHEVYPPMVREAPPAAECPG